MIYDFRFTIDDLAACQIQIVNPKSSIVNQNYVQPIHTRKNNRRPKLRTGRLDRRPARARNRTGSHCPKIPLLGRAAPGIKAHCGGRLSLRRRTAAGAGNASRAAERAARHRRSGPPLHPASLRLYPAAQPCRAFRAIVAFIQLDHGRNARHPHFSAT